MVQLKLFLLSILFSVAGVAGFILTLALLLDVVFFA